MARAEAAAREGENVKKTQAVGRTEGAAQGDGTRRR
jgi:hypothetical protein